MDSKYSQRCVICNLPIIGTGAIIYDTAGNPLKASCDRERDKGTFKCSYLLNKTEQYKNLLDAGVEIVRHYKAAPIIRSEKTTLTLTKMIFFLSGVLASPIYSFTWGMTNSENISFTLVLTGLVLLLSLFVLGPLAGFVHSFTVAPIVSRNAQKQIDKLNQPLYVDERLPLTAKKKEFYNRELKSLGETITNVRALAANEERQYQEEINRLKSDWERTLHSKLSERDRFSKNGVLRIKGTKLLSLIDWRQFEVVLTHILRHRGWQARTTNRGADGGVDVEGTRGTQRLYLQAKHYKSGTNVGRPALQMLMGVAQSKGATHAILATSSGFTRQAKDEPTNNLNYSLELWEGRKVATLIDALSTEVYEEIIEPMKRDLLKSL